MSKGEKGKKPSSADKKLYAARARVFKALGNPSRLVIVDALQDGPKNVNELAKIIGASLATTSRHIASLREAGILAEGERRGNMIFYKLNVACIPDFMRCVTEVMKKKRDEWR